MKVRELIKELKKMPQDEECGQTNHDMGVGDSFSIYAVMKIDDDMACNDSGLVDHRVVICS